MELSDFVVLTQICCYILASHYGVYKYQLSEYTVLSDGYTSSKVIHDLKIKIN